MKDFVYLAGDSLECHIYETLKYAEATHKGKCMWRVTCYQGFPLPQGRYPMSGRIYTVSCVHEKCLRRQFSSIWYVYYQKAFLQPI